MDEDNSNSINMNVYTIQIDVFNPTLKKTTICHKYNHIRQPPNVLVLTLKKTDHFDDPIDDTLPEQPERLITVSIDSTIKGLHTLPIIILGYIVRYNDVNILYEVLYSSEHGTRVEDTILYYNDQNININMNQPFLIVYMDKNKKIKLVGNKYLNLLLTSVYDTPIYDINIKLGAHFSNQVEYMKQYYSLLASNSYFNGKSNLLIHLNPLCNGILGPMEPTDRPFTKMKTSFLALKKPFSVSNVYFIRNLHPPDTIQEMRDYINSPEFKILYRKKVAATSLSRALNGRESGDITQEYDRFILFFMEKIDLMINYKNWIRTLANAIGVDAYISFVMGAGTNAQLNIMDNYSNKDMNLGVHTDYDTKKEILYPYNTDRDTRKTVRTILCYVDLYDRGKPTVGLTTKISAMSKSDSRKYLLEYSIKEKCKNYIRLHNMMQRIIRILDTLDEDITSSLRKYEIAYKPLPEFIPKNVYQRRQCIVLNNVDSILLPDIDDPYYFFNTQRNDLKRNDYPYKEMCQIVHEKIERVMNDNKDITYWNIKLIYNNCDEIYKSLNEYNTFVISIKSLSEMDQAPTWIKYLYRLLTIDNEFMKVHTILNPVYFFALIIVDVQTFIDTYLLCHLEVQQSGITREQIQDTLEKITHDHKEYQEMLCGISCPFIDGGIIYFNGEMVHTPDAGIGKRVSIVYKVSYVDRDPNNILSIEEREAEYFNQFKDDKPLPFPTRNNVII